VGVWNEQTSIRGTLQTSENSVTSGGSGQSDVQNSLEWSLFLAFTFLLNIVEFSVDGLVSVVKLVKLGGVEESSGAEEASGVAGSIVGETCGKSVLLEFSGLSVAEDLVTLDGGVDDLADDLGVGDSWDEPVFMGVVLVLVLHNESLSGIIVGLVFSASSESGLEPLEVSL